MNTSSPSLRVLSPVVKTRQAMEKRIIRQILKSAIEAGKTVTAFDDMAGFNGGEMVIEKSASVAAIMKKLFTTDSDLLVINDGENQLGYVQLVYGNSGYDVIVDYTVNLEELLTEANALAERLDMAAAS